MCSSSGDSTDSLLQQMSPVVGTASVSALKNVLSIFIPLSATPLISIFFIALLYEWLASFIMDVISAFYKALSENDVDLFRTTVWKSAMMVILLSIVKAIRTFLVEYNASLWRNLISTHLLQIVHSCGISRHLLLSNNKVDNIDQRIAQDTDAFTSKLIAFINDIIVAPFIIIYYAHFLYNLFGPLPPLICFVYFCGGSIITTMLISPLPKLIYYRELLEGYFRSSLSRSLVQLESILFLNGNEYELRVRIAELSAVIQQMLAIAQRHFLVNTFSELFSYGGSILNYCLVGFCLFRLRQSEASAGERAALLSKGSFACLYLLSGFSTCLQAYSAFGDIMGLCQRISEIIRLGKGYESKGAPFTPLAKEIHESSGLLDIESKLDAHSGYDGDLTGAKLSPHHRDAIVLTVDSVDIICPLSSPPRILVHSLTFQLTKGAKLLVTGPSGSGKTSLLRMLHRLFDSAHGLIHFSTSRVFFSPQISYIFKGSLAENIMYPAHLSSVRYEEISALLEKVFLGHLKDIYGYETVADFAGILSPGEQQRLSIARVLFHRPQMVFLDEATSSLDEGTEKSLYYAVSDCCESIVSIGHRMSLVPLHTHRLHFLGDGSYKYTNLP